VNQKTIVGIAIFLCLLGSACNRGVSGTVAGAEVTVLSMKRMPEFKAPGSMTSAPAHASDGHEFAVFALKSNPGLKQLGTREIKVTLIDDKGRVYAPAYLAQFGFEDSRTDITILFEIPTHTMVKTLILETTSFDLSKLKI
jgi:hypothetical protein